MTDTFQTTDIARAPALLNPAHSAPLPVKRVIAFDGLRGVCALMVLFHHLLLTQPIFANYEWHIPQKAAYSWSEWLLTQTPLRLLWAGQERALLFFVLSGFVLSLPWLDKHPASYGRYLLGRLCRIYPPYLIAMIIAALASTWLGGHSLNAASIYVKQEGWVFKPSWASIPSILGVIDNQSSDYMDEAVWSLVWEVRVALIFPLIIIPIVRWRNAAILPIYLTLLSLNYLTRHIFNHEISVVLNSPNNTFYFAEFFLIGCAVAANRDAIATWSLRFGSGLGNVLLIAGCMICWIPWPVEHERLIGIGAAMILAAILESERIQGWLEKGPLLWLGRQSYSLYLIHVPVLMAVTVAFNGAVPLAAFYVVVPVVIFLAELFRRVVEMPSVALAQRLTGYSRK